MGLVAGEILARIFLPLPQTVIAPKENAASPLGSKFEVHSIPSHPDQGFIYVETPTGRRLRPNVDVTIEHHVVSGQTVEIRTNRLGFRNAEFGEKKGLRILFLGDSIIFGDYLPEDQTIVRQVDALSKADGRNWELINAGVGAICLKDEVAILVETGLSIDPDVVVVGFYLNDFLPSPGVFRSRIPEPISYSRLASFLWVTVPNMLSLPDPEQFRGQSSSLDHSRLERWKDEFRRTHKLGYGDPLKKPAAMNSMILKKFWDWGGSWSPYAWHAMTPLFQQLRDLADAHHFKLLIIAFPVSYQVRADFVDDDPQQQLNRVAEKMGVPVLDLLPTLREAHQSGQPEMFYDQCHHTPLGVKIISPAIYRFLQEQIAAQ